jgi:hypothetical protein
MNCLECENKLERSHRVWNKYIIRLSGTIYAVSMGYKCPNHDCPMDVVYRSALAESLSLKYYSFGLDVIAAIGDMRFSENKTIGEIHCELLKSISISEREIQYLIEIYMLLIAGIKQDKSYLDGVISPEGIILSIDGVQPEKGNEALYILRDVLSGEVLCAKNLLSSDVESIKGMLQSVIDLSYPILGVISDGQDTIRKSVSDLLPETPYQLCHYHYLNNAGKGLEEKDRKLKTKLKKELRGISKVERDIEKLEPGCEKDVLKDFAVAIRTTLLENSVYPFDCGGIKVYDHLIDLESALESCQKERGHPLLTRMKEMVSGYRPYTEEYEDAIMLLTITRRIAELIDPDNFLGDNVEKRKQRLTGYMGYVAKLKADHPGLSGHLEQILKATRSFLPGLFTYLQCPLLPVTNNDLEIFHRKMKTEHRRRTGRKSSHDYIIRYGRFAVYQMGRDCAGKLKTLAYSKLKVLKGQLMAIRNRYSKMYQVRHKPSEFFMGLIDRWCAGTEPSNAPT